MIIMIDLKSRHDFACCSRRLCGGEVVTFCCDRKVPKNAQRGLKSERAGISAPSGLPPPPQFLEGKSCVLFPCRIDLLYMLL